MNQQEQNTASTKAFILECIDYKIESLENIRHSLITQRYNDRRIKELKIRRQDVVEMLEGVEDE